MKFFSFKKLLWGVIALAFIFICLPASAEMQKIKSNSIEKKLSVLEASSGIKLGVFAIDTANNTHLQYRSKERFPIQSTFKVMLVSAILKPSERDPYLLQQKIKYKKTDLVFWSPITEKNLAHGMAIFDLCAAAIMYSDNTATNLLMKKIGGPKAVTRFARSIGDNTFRIDGWEPNLNSNPNGIDDTSTPLAMVNSLQKFTFGNVLAASQREQLINWMKGNTTGNQRIRAGVPQGWIVADKTGSSNDYGIANDIGIIWPPSGAPIFVAIYSVHKQKNVVSRDEVIASVTRLLIDEFFN